MRGSAKTDNSPYAAAASKSAGVSVEYVRMSVSGGSTANLEGARRKHLEERLRQVEEQFCREMRARGFNPDQDDNLALTAPLARLYAEREQLREELESKPEI